MTVVADNLAYLLAKNGLNATLLAGRTGVPQPTIHRILSGDSTDPRTATLFPLAEYFGVTVEWLRTPEGTPDAPRAPRRKGAAVQPGDFVTQVRAQIQVDAAGYVTGRSARQDIITHHTDDDGAYAIVIDSDTLRPRVNAGEHISLAPGRWAEPGDDVLVLYHDGRALIRELLYVRDSIANLGALSGDAPPLAVPLADIKRMHCIAAIVTRTRPEPTPTAAK